MMRPCLGGRGLHKSYYTYMEAKLDVKCSFLDEVTLFQYFKVK